MNAGDLFRHYRVLEKVGEGGMGVVYRARDTKLDRDVALKFMVHATGVNPEHADRLRREARALAALNHPNILTIHDIGDADGSPFLVLEWVGGGALNDTPLQRPLSTDEFLRIVLPVADALGTAHQQGIVHRDVKPANVLVCDDGRIKLADFGLAKFRDLNRDLTRTAGIIGTVAYMSPEQACGDEVGPASDVFSLGVLAYELLTGTPAVQRRQCGRGDRRHLERAPHAAHGDAWTGAGRTGCGRRAVPAARAGCPLSIRERRGPCISTGPLRRPIASDAGQGGSGVSSATRCDAPPRPGHQVLHHLGRCVPRLFRRGCGPVHRSRARPFHAPRDGMGLA